ncbi:MAG: hypothetical protein QM757_20805 [Paludibaculum sp.]
MWIINVALNRPYTFIVLALLILIIAPGDDPSYANRHLPEHQYPSDLRRLDHTLASNPEELEGRLTSPYEKALTALVDNIEHIESTTYNGIVVVKIVSSSRMPASIPPTPRSRRHRSSCCDSCPPGTLPPMIINFNASSVPVLQLGVSGEGLSEHQLNDLA